MKAAGLQPRIDPAGNIFARARWRRSAAAADPASGRTSTRCRAAGTSTAISDRCRALAAIEALDAAGVRTRHPLEMVVWAHEEGFAFGRGLACSRIVAGDVDTGRIMAEVWNGMTRADAIRKIGGDPDRIAAAQRAAEGSPITAISSCTSSRAGRSSARHRPSASSKASSRSTATTRSSPASPTTPARRRLPNGTTRCSAAAHLTIAVRDAVTRTPGRQVGTVGHIEVTPNSPNVIPGLAQLSIELRDLIAAEAASR